MHKRKLAIWTYLCNDLFLEGAIALITSLRKNSPESFRKCDINCLCLEEVSKSSLVSLKKEGYNIKILQKKKYLIPNHKDFLGRYASSPWLTFNKLYIFSYTEYETILYLDADTIVRNEIFELFNSQSYLAAVEDELTPNLNNKGINSGVMVIKPNRENWELIKKNINTKFNQKHTDQSLINALFYDFVRLSRKYNTLEKIQRST